MQSILVLPLLSSRYAGLSLLSILLENGWPWLLAGIWYGTSLYPYNLLICFYKSLLSHTVELVVDKSSRYFVCPIFNQNTAFTNLCYGHLKQVYPPPSQEMYAARSTSWWWCEVQEGAPYLCCGEEVLRLSMINHQLVKASRWVSGISWSVMLQWVSGTRDDAIVIFTCCALSSLAASWLVSNLRRLYAAGKDVECFLNKVVSWRKKQVIWSMPSLRRYYCKGQTQIWLWRHAAIASECAVISSIMRLWSLIRVIRSCFWSSCVDYVNVRPRLP